MHLLITFDIYDNKRRRKVVKLLQRCGYRVQYSVFEASIKPNEFKQLTSNISNVLLVPDRVHYMPLCGKDLRTRQADGKTEVLQFSDYQQV